MQDLDTYALRSAQISKAADACLLDEAHPGRRLPRCRPRMVDLMSLDPRDVLLGPKICVTSGVDLEDYRISINTMSG